jgi:pimeloyl-ACP methyl ester carboxylesterase
VDQWLSDLSRTGAKSVLVFIHGFGNDATAIVTRHRMIKSRLPPDVCLVSFDWPSGNSGATAEEKYTKDKANAAAIVLRLYRDCLSDKVLFSKFAPPNVHLFAHSMGAFVTEQAFLSTSTSDAFRVGHVLMAAADVDRLNYLRGSISLQNFITKCSDLTAYWSQDDEALKSSVLAKVNNKAVPLGLRGFPDPAIPDRCIAVEGTAYYERTAIKGLPPDMDADEYSHVWYLFYQPQAPLLNDFYIDMNEVLTGSSTSPTRTQNGYQRLR